VSRAALRPTQSPVKMGTWGTFPGAKPGRIVTLTTHPHLVPRSRMSRSYTSFPPSTTMACSGTALLTCLQCAAYLPQRETPFYRQMLGAFPPYKTTAVRQTVVTQRPCIIIERFFSNLLYYFFLVTVCIQMCVLYFSFSPLPSFDIA
jgi:hypothetical protein